MKKILYLVYCVGTLLAWGCSSTKIEDRSNFQPFEIKEGEEITLLWEFKNADNVTIAGFPKLYNAKDFLVDKPLKSRQYYINAFKGSDTVKRFVHVEVIPNTPQQEIKTGPVVLRQIISGPSYEESEYLNGVLTHDIQHIPSSMHVMRTKINEKNKTCNFNVLLLDQLGNYINGYSYKSDKASWTSTNSCGSVSANYSGLKYSEKKNDETLDFIDLGLLIDNSAASDNEDIPLMIKSFLPGLMSGDKIMISAFNQNYHKILDLMPVEQMIMGFDNDFRLPKKSGLSAVNKASYKALGQLAKGHNSKKALILLTYLSDNSSLTYDENDVALFAKNNDIPIYIVGIGEAVNGYDLRYLCSLTGARYYFIMKDELKSLNNILTEIIFSLRNNYKVTVPIQSFDENCTVKKANLQFITNDKNISESVTIQNDYKSLFAANQILANYDEGSSRLKEEYLENIKLFAKTLSDNPNKSVQLTAYSWYDGAEDIQKTIAEERLNAIKELLLNSGAGTEQIKMKYEGENKPIFPNSKGWQANINRRVEVRWLDPSIQPYELLGEHVKSEDEAQKLVEKWESRGNKAYYERLFQQDEIGYRIRIWGFSTIDDARKAAIDIKDKYEVVMEVE